MVSIKLQKVSEIKYEGLTIRVYQFIGRIFITNHLSLWQALICSLICRLLHLVFISFCFWAKRELWKHFDTSSTWGIILNTVRWESFKLHSLIHL